MLDTPSSAGEVIVVVSIACALMVIVDEAVVNPAGTAVFPVSWIVIDTATAVPAVVGVPDSGQVGGVMEEIGPTVRPSAAKPVEVHEYVVCAAGRPPIEVTVRLGVAFRYGCAAFCVHGAIGVERPVAMLSAASVVILYEVSPSVSVVTLPAGTEAFAVSVAMTMNVVAVPPAWVIVAALQDSVGAA